MRTTFEHMFYVRIHGAR